MNLLAVSGSLRVGSSNQRLLEALRLSAPPECNVALRAPLDDLPYFNPDLEEAGPPAAAARWRAEVGACDVLVLSSPEYIHGVPGVLKNALDWLAGGLEMAEKRVALLNATPPTEHATASLRETLGVLGARFVEPACLDFPLRGSKLTPAAIAADPVLSARLRAVFEALRAFSV